MAESGSQNADSKASAPKDKNCPYCGQAFTSSSLGRHLDLYIKAKNPKAPDGIHDVDAIRRLRGAITRRQPRGSTGGRREVSTPVSTPRAAARPPSRAASDARDSETPFRSPVIPRDGHYVVDSTLSKYPFTPSWEATGVMNDIPMQNGDSGREGESTQVPARRTAASRAVSKQTVHKGQFDVKHKLADAMDTARAAELALRELLGSWRAAKQHLDNNSMPFDFDPLSLDFPALTLQCLQPPPTLFSSTQHPTPTSWSVQSPGKREFGALQAYFAEEFRAFKIACASATTTSLDEMTYPPASAYRDPREAVRRAEKSAETLEKQVAEHLVSAFAAWEGLPASRRSELWVLELARGVGRRQKETEALKQQQHRLRQETANLKSQIDQLNRLQQPKEFKLMAPATIPLDQAIVAHVLEQGMTLKKGVGLGLEDRHLDLSTVVGKAIERWKTVITSTRAMTQGMSAQKTLDQAAADVKRAVASPPATTQSKNNAQTRQQNQQSKQQQQQQHQHQPPQLQRQMTGCTTNGSVSEAAASTTGAPSVEDDDDVDVVDVDGEEEEEDDDDDDGEHDENGSEDADADGGEADPGADADADADAEMEDDDSYPVEKTMAQHIMQQRPQQHQHHQEHQHQQASLDMPTVRGPVLRGGGGGGGYGQGNGLMHSGRVNSISMSSRTMPNMQAVMQAGLHAAGMGMAMQGLRGDAMYME